MLLNLKNFYRILFLFFALIFSGCDNVFNQNGIAKNLDASMKPLMIEIVDFIYPLLGFIGLIVLAISFNTLFLTKANPSESPVSKLLGGTMEFIIAACLISSKEIVKFFFGS